MKGDQRPIAIRFWSQVDRQPGNGCWNWTGSTIPDGYGKIMINGKRVLTHRLSYIWYYGSIPEGLVLDHLCRNTLCLRPDHLEAVTQKVNTNRGIGICAKNAIKETCPRGHKYDATFKYKGQVARYCRTCKKEQQQRCIKRKRTKLAA